MTELQQRRKLGWVKDKQGQVLHDPLRIAEALVQHWSSVSVTGKKSVDECIGYLKGLGLPGNLENKAKALFRPLTEEIVQEALHRLYNGVS